MIYNSVGEIYEALNKTRTKLIAKSATLTAEQKVAREDGQGWSVTEIIEHLALIEGNLFKIIGKLLAKAESENGLSDGQFNPPISFLEQAQIAQNTKFNAPEMLCPHGAQSVEESLLKLEESRQALNELQTRIEASDSSKTAFPHPGFGNLNLYQWLILIGLHEYRHLTQIDRILAK